ncbi:cobalt transporter, partial [Bacillus wiedmannii]
MEKERGNMNYIENNGLYYRNHHPHGGHNHNGGHHHHGGHNHYDHHHHHGGGWGWGG